MNRALMCLMVTLLFVSASYGQFAKHNNIKFDFWAVTLSEFEGTIKVYGTLFNPNTDTVYLLTTSCDGMQYGLQFDSSKFTHTPFLLCNASWPVIEKIPPEGKLDFTAHLKNIGINKEIKLGFDLYEVEKSFNINKPGLRIYTRNKDDKNIIWTDLHRFE